MSSNSLRYIVAAFLSSSAAPLCATSITLMNDSVFPLTANIINAQGGKEGTINLSPGQSYIWYGDNGSFKTLDNATMTPYTVRWICNAARPYDYSTTKQKKGQKVPPKYQSEYGAWQGVPSTATVTAQGCTAGAKTCVIKKAQKQPTKPKAIRIHKAPARHPNARKSNISNDGAGNFSNDGGLSWSNDGGDPFADFSKEDFSEEQDEDGTKASDVNQQ